MTEVPDQLLPASTWWELLEIELILKYFTLGAIAGRPSVSQEESFLISFTYILYNIFYKKSNKDFSSRICFIQPLRGKP